MKFRFSKSRYPFGRVTEGVRVPHSRTSCADTGKTEFSQVILAAHHVLKLSNEYVIARPLLRSKSFITTGSSWLATNKVQPFILRFWFARVFIGLVGFFWSCQASVSSGRQITLVFHSKGFVTLHPDFSAQSCSSVNLNSFLVGNLISKSFPYL